MFSLFDVLLVVICWVEIGLVLFIVVFGVIVMYGS